MAKITGGLIFVAALFLLSVGFGSFYTIDQTERGVILRNGAITGTADPGLHFKTPFLEDVATIDMQQHVVEYDQVAAYSKDQQPTVVKLSINYRLDPSKRMEIYTDYRGRLDTLQARAVDRKAISAFKNVFGRYTAVSAIQDRAKLSAEATDAIKASVDGPVIIETVQIENIDFSDNYEKSIEQRMAAEVEVQKSQQQANNEKVLAQITVTKAQAEADSQLARARASADATKLQGDAEAYAIKVKSEALNANPNLIDLTKAERWDGKLPTSLVPGSAIPFINIK